MQAFHIEIILLPRAVLCVVLLGYLGMNTFGVPVPPERTARHIAEEEDEDEEVGSNPDELIDESASQVEDEGEGEDLNDNWLK